MNALLIYLLEASICLGVFYLFYLAVLHRQPSFQYNRIYLLVASALGWILPLLNVPFGSVSNSPVAGKAAAYLLLSPAEVGSTTAPTVDLVFWAGVLYGVGILISLTLYGKQFYRLYRVVRSSQAQSVPHGRYRLLYTNGQFPTSSFFRYLFWDNSQPLTVEETRQIMIHEETHIRQGHSYDVLYITLLKIVGWFHPLVYLYDRALTQTHEYAADAGVLKQTSVNQKAYARLLSKHMLTSRNVVPVNHFFYPSQILTRIHMIYASTKKTPWYRYVMIVPVFASLFFTFSCQPDEEEVTRQVVAQSYDEVTQAIETIDGHIQRIQEKYYPTQQAFMEALDNYRAEHAGPPPSEVDIIESKASSSDLKQLKRLIEQRDGLREKLAHLPDADGVYTVVENKPEPANGIKEFYQFIGNNMKYPAQARRMGIEGKVFVQFVVNKYGGFTDVKVIKGIGAGCDKEAVRVVKEAPEWKPGTTADGKPVNVRMVLPVTFKLGNGTSGTTSRGEEGTEGAIEEKLSAESERSQIDEMVIVGYQN